MRENVPARVPSVVLALFAACAFASCAESNAPNICAGVTEPGPLLSAPDEIGAMTCATLATPDVAAADSSQVDTGAAFLGQPAQYFVGPAYGQPACPDQFLLERDLASTNADGQSVYSFAAWSVILPGAPCARQATMTVWGYDGATWSLFDRIIYEGQPFTDDTGTPYCHANPQQRLRPSSLDVTSIPANTFAKLRVAAVATECDHKVPVDVIVESP